MAETGKPHHFLQPGRNTLYSSREVCIRGGAWDCCRIDAQNGSRRRQGRPRSRTRARTGRRCSHTPPPRAERPPTACSPHTIEVTTPRAGAHIKGKSEGASGDIPAVVPRRYRWRERERGPGRTRAAVLVSPPVKTEADRGVWAGGGDREREKLDTGAVQGQNCRV